MSQRNVFRKWRHKFVCVCEPNCNDCCYKFATIPGSAAATVRPRAGSVMSWAQDRIGRMLARYLEQPATGYEPFTPSNPDTLVRSLKPGDVLLVEGNNHIAGVIKYLTQSTWSHSALYVGPVLGRFAEHEPHVLIEAEIGKGVISSPLSKYFKFHTRVCRPVGLTAQDLEKVCRYAIERIGFDY